MIENANQAEEQEIEISVEDDAVVEAKLSQDDELETYTKSVSKRINKLNAKTRAAEERAQMAEQIAHQREAEIQALRSHSQAQAGTVLLKEEEAMVAKEAQADDLYKKAIESGDADLMSKADTLKSDLSIQKEKIRLAKNRQDTEQAQYNQAVQQQGAQAQQQQQQQQQPAVEPTTEALGWYEQNKWYGDADDKGNLEATQFAYFQHYNLINEGHEPDSDEYYDELNSRVYKVYPHLQNASVSKDAQAEAKPSVQRVASATVGSSRQKTQGKKNGVTFSRSEVERLRGLKPHNMSEDAWLKRVAVEKQRIASREAM
jgi:hypothetical protein|tara:strand:+ start:295 stop:1242 length:948 start_codon:yes stop_codon:yes gene_type:complete